MIYIEPKKVQKLLYGIHGGLKKHGAISYVLVSKGNILAKHCQESLLTYTS